MVMKVATVTKRETKKFRGIVPDPVTGIQKFFRK